MHVLDLIIVSVELFDMFPAIMMMINNAIKTVVRLYSKISNQDCTIIGKKKSDLVIKFGCCLVHLFKLELIIMLIML